MFEPVIDVAACPRGAAVFVRHRGLELAVYHLDDGSVAVSDNACPHASGNLAAGSLDGRRITCPVHHWVFDLDSGYCVGTHDVVVRRYAARIVAGRVEVDVARPLPVPAPPPRDY